VEVTEVTSSTIITDCPLRRRILAVDPRCPGHAPRRCTRHRPVRCLADDPQVRFTGSGQQVTELIVLVNQRRPNSDGEWVEVEPTRHVVRVFKTVAENIAESLAKEDRVFVHETVTTEAWTDRQAGEKRTAQRVLAEIVGPSLLSHHPDHEDHPIVGYRPAAARRQRTGGLIQSGRASAKIHAGRPHLPRRRVAATA
jgi:single-strand DNA-binding protein